MEIRRLKEAEYNELKLGIQEAFQKGFEDYFGKCEQVIIPDKDILNSYTKKGSVSYVAVEDNKIIGGVIVVINEESQINSLDILYTKVGLQSKGIGFALWNEMERLYPNTKVWKTCTPTFDKRNYHFYVDKCGFTVTEIVNEHDEETPDDFIGDHGEGMYEFEKVTK